MRRSRAARSVRTRIPLRHTTVAITHKTIKDLPIATAWPASKAAFHCLYFSPKRTTTMSSRRMRGDFKHGLACDFKASPCLKR